MNVAAGIETKAGPSLDEGDLLGDRSENQVSPGNHAEQSGLREIAWAWLYNRLAGIKWRVR